MTDKILVDQSSLRLLQRHYRDEMDARKKLQASYDILQDQHSNLQKWIRDKKLIDPKILDIMLRIDPLELEEFLDSKKCKSK